MVGVQLQMPASNHAGYEQMQDIKRTMVDHFGDNCQIKQDDRASIKLKLRWDGPLGSLFTITLTPNTGYIQIQGPMDKTLTLAHYVRDLVGGDVYATRQAGAAPHNPSEHESDDGATNAGSMASAHGAADHAAGQQSHGATDHAASQQGTTQRAANDDTPNSQEAADHGASGHSGSIGVGVSPITGNGNVQVGTVVINTGPEDSEGNATAQAAMTTLINGVRNLLRRAPASED